MPRLKINLFTRLKRTRIYNPYVNKTLPKRLDWEQIEEQPRREGKSVVKGTTKRVIVVKSPNPEIFEQAIFIVREGYTPEGADAADEILKEAERVAQEYIKGRGGAGKLFSKIPPPVFAAAVAALTGAAMLILM